MENYIVWGTDVIYQIFEGYLNLEPALKLAEEKSARCSVWKSNGFPAHFRASGNYLLIEQVYAIDEI